MIVVKKSGTHVFTFSDGDFASALLELKVLTVAVEGPVSDVCLEGKAEGPMANTLLSGISPALSPLPQSLHEYLLRPCPQ